MSGSRVCVSISQLFFTDVDVIISVFSSCDVVTSLRLFLIVVFCSSETACALNPAHVFSHAH